VGQRGPAPQPTVLKYIRGNPGKRPLNDSEPKPDEIADVQCPDWLSGDAKKKWERVYPVLRSMRMLTVADEESLARYCALWAEWKRHYDFSRQPGGDIYTLMDAEGNVRYMSPTAQTSLMLKLTPLLLRLEQEFGLTPSSRSQVSIHDSPEEDPLQAFIALRGKGAG
jgi:P27 family predicted phage terminase small subunit